jgi:hypothetical protein
MGILVEMVNTVGVKERGAPLDSMYLIAFGQEQLSQICPILARNAGNQCFFQCRMLPNVEYSTWVQNGFV